MANKDIIDIVVVDEPEEMLYNAGYKNSKDKDRLIKRIERYVRSSMEYKDYIAFLRENMNMDACAFFNNISKEGGKRIRIEVHHAPLTLYDIVSTVLTKYEAEGMPLNDLMIADEVMKLHYENMVGLIPLSKTIHEVIHKSPTEKIVLPAYMIYGNFKEFLEKYGEYAEDCEHKIEHMIEVTKQLKKESFDVLERKYTYLEVDGFTMPAKIDLEKNDKSKDSLVA